MKYYWKFISELFLATMLLLVFNNFSYGDACPTITPTTTAIAASNYTVSSGQILKIPSGVNYNNSSYNITLSGGTIYVESGGTLDMSRVIRGNSTFTVNAASGTPITITTSSAHGYSAGNTVGIQGITGNEAANGTWTIGSVTSTTFTLLDPTTGANSVSSGTYSSGGIAQIFGTITNCGTLSGTPNNSYKWAGVIINNYSTNTLTYDPNGTGGLINNYATATLSLSNFYGGTALVNKAGNTASITTSSITCCGGTRIFNYGTINFSSTFSFTAGGSSNHNVFTNYSTGTLNFNATGSTGLTLTAYSDLSNYGAINFATVSVATALESQANSTFTNYSTGVVTATNGDYITNGGNLDNYGTETFRDFTINSASASINVYDYSLLKISKLLTVNSANRLSYGGSGNCAFVDVSGGNGANYTGNLTLTSSTGVKICGQPGGTTGSTFTINAVTNANPTTITTSSAHGFSVGQVIYLNLNSGTAGTISTGYYEVYNVPSTTQVMLKSLTSPYTKVSSTSTTVSGSPNMALTNFGTALSFGDASAACSTAAANHSCSSPLPIELLSFDAKAQSDDVIVTWSSATEENNKFYTVLRSFDGINFEPIGIVNGGGNSNQTIEYHFIDQNPLSGLSYYKLQQTDFDGKSESFDIVTVNYKLDENAWILYPNPTNGNQLYIKFLGKLTSVENPVLINIYDLAGKEIFITVLHNYSEDESLLNTSNELSKGVYLVKVRFNDEVKFEKLVVK